MPTYDYECSKCGITFEHFQSMNDEPLKTCIHPEGCCNPKAKAKVQRLLGTGAGLIFKGSGFYSTDYRSSEYAQSAKKDSSSSSSGESSSKSEAPTPAPAATTESSSKKTEKKKSADS